MLWRGAILAACLLLAACSGSATSLNESVGDVAGTDVAEADVAGTPEEVASVEVAESADDGLQDSLMFDVAPPVEVFNVENELVLDPLAYCWVDECASGDWMADPLEVAGVVGGEIRFRFPVRDWDFSAFIQTEQGQNRTPTPVESLGGGEFSIGPIDDPAGPVVELFGRGPAGEIDGSPTFGDVTVVFFVDWNNPNS